MSEEKILEVLIKITAKCVEQGDNCSGCKMYVPIEGRVNEHCCTFAALAKEFACAPCEWDFERIRKLLKMGEGLPIGWTFKYDDHHGERRN